MGKIVLVKRGGDAHPVDIGEGEEAVARLTRLVNEHGAAAVTEQDGSTVQIVDTSKAQPQRSRKATSKRKSSKKKTAKKRR